jgi:hypothetical protein
MIMKRQEKRTSNRPFSFIKIWELFRGRNRARANLCPGKFVNKSSFLCEFFVNNFGRPIPYEATLCAYQTMSGRATAPMDNPRRATIMPAASCNTRGSCELHIARAAPGCQISSCKLRLEIFTNSVQLRAAKFRSQKIHNLFTI